MHYRNVIAVLVCSAGLIHQHSLNYSLLNREIRKHSKHKFKLNLIVTKVNVVRYQNYMSVESDFAECRGGWREDLHRLTLYTFAYRRDKQARRSACRTGISFTATGGRIEMHYRVFGEQIAVGIELEVVAGFVE